MKKVSIVSCNSYDTEELNKAVRKSIDLIGGMEKYIKKGDRVLLKPNILFGKSPDKCVNTHPSFIEVIASMVKEAGGIPFLGDSPGFGSTLSNAKKAQYYDICEKHDIPIVDFTENKLYNFEKGYLFKSFELESTLRNYDKIINLPKLKTHGMMMLTLAVKNLYGLVSGYKKLHWHMIAKDDYILFGKFLIDLYRFISPALNILDGIDAMEGNGPQSGVPRKCNMIISSPNGISLDRIVCDIVGLKPDSVPVIKAALDFGLDDIHNIEMLGEDPGSLKIKNFRLPRRNLLTFYRFPAFIHRFLKKYFLVLPIIDKKTCTKCKICIKSCPNHVISYNEDIIRIDYEKCIRCYCCQEMCPEGAIKLK